MNYYRSFARLVFSVVSFFSHILQFRFVRKRNYFKKHAKFNAKTLRFNLCRICAVVLIGSLLLTSTPAAVPMTIGAASEFKQDAVFWAYQNNWLGQLYGYFFTPAVESNSNQNASVSRIEIYPGGALSIGAGSRTVFSALAYDNNDQLLSGVKFKWRVRDIGRRRNPRPLQHGVFEAELPGTFKITVEARGRQAESTVVVTGTPLGILEGQLASAPRRNISSRQNENPAQEGQSLETNAKNEGSEKTKENIAEEAASASMLPDGGWNNENWQTADDPYNQIGDPPGTPLDDGAGSGNFQMAAPILSLSGRSTNLALNLNYNSRLWHKSGTEITYDIDRGFPAPGWSLVLCNLSFCNNIFVMTI